MRTFLVVVDESKEMLVALRYAAWRARKEQGSVAMLHVIEPVEIQPWAGVEEALTEDAIARAREGLMEHEKLVETISGAKPVLFIRRGECRAVLMKLLAEQPDISVLVLGAQTAADGPGSLISHLTSAKGLRALKIPLVIVPDTYQIPADLQPV
ncbi:MAG: universal stress protein [Alphaproteobacteria bacterium]|nr:universal stress protein [Alphaproteobacteria bacterium]